MVATLGNFPARFEAVKDYYSSLFASVTQCNRSANAGHTQCIGISQRRQDFLRTMTKRIGPHDRQNFTF